MKNVKYVLSIIAFLTGCFVTGATNFFDTAKPDKFIFVGVRTGANLSTVKASKDYYDINNSSTWNTGFEMGFVADIYLRNFISLQAGIGFQARYSDYRYSASFFIPSLEEGPDKWKPVYTQFDQSGHISTYNIVIPVIGALHFNIGSKVKWNLEFGPYLNYRIGGNGTPKTYMLKIKDNKPEIKSADAKYNLNDIGFKMGTGFTFFSHYNIQVHYMCGTKNVWSSYNLKGRNKAWTFTLGYTL